MQFTLGSCPRSAYVSGVGVMSNKQVKTGGACLPEGCAALQQ